MGLLEVQNREVQVPAMQCLARPGGTGGVQPPAPALRLCKAGGSGGGLGPPKDRVMTELVLDSVLTRFCGVKYYWFVGGTSLAQCHLIGWFVLLYLFFNNYHLQIRPMETSWTHSGPLAAPTGLL